MDLRPSTDDWPFYSQTVKKEDVASNIQHINVNFYYGAPFVLLSVIAKYFLLFSFIFLLLPLLIFNMEGFRELRNKTTSIIYFASLGLAFMLVEIVLMQKYMLILGHPIYSFSVVLSSLLISTGIGSFISERYKNPYRAIIYGLLGIMITILISFLFFHFLSDYVIMLNFTLKIIIITFLTGLSGIFMGFMLPSGIRAISSVESSIPWVWAVNGIFSVVAGFISIYISILYGFKYVLAIGVLIYLIGTILFCFKLKMRDL